MVHVGGYHEYIVGRSVHQRDAMGTSGGDTMSTLGDILSTSEDVQYIGGISRFMWGDIMSTSCAVQYIRGIS